MKLKFVDYSFDIVKYRALKEPIKSKFFTLYFYVWREFKYGGRNPDEVFLVEYLKELQRTNRKLDKMDLEQALKILCEQEVLTKVS